MKDDIVTPKYLQIAVDIATRIANGEFKENSKIYGRSVMSSQYGVSPETIRRALKLLSDMNVVDIKQSSGAIVLSKQKAKEYIRHFNGKAITHSLHLKLKNLVTKQEKMNKEIVNLTNMISKNSAKWSISNPLENFEIDVQATSPVVGKSIKELNFWHATGATIVALRREGKLILSPGPYAVISPNDTIIFIGVQSAVDAVNLFLYPKK